MSRSPTVLSLLDLNPRKFGSMEEFTVVLSGHLQQAGMRSVLAFSHPLSPAIADRFKASGCILEVLNWRSGANFYLELVRILRKYRPKVVHLHFYEQFSLLPVVLRAAGVTRIIYTDHCRQPVTFSSTRQLALKIWNGVVPPLTGSRFLAISGHIKRVLTDCFFMDPKRIDVILNAVNVERFQPANPEWCASLRKKFNISDGMQVVCAIASLIPEKGITYYLQGAKQVLEGTPNTMFLVAGDGRLSSPLQREAQDLGIAANVRFLGLISDVSDLMAMSDVVVVPSIWQEPAGLVVIEAMASGRPVVASRVGGIPEYVKDGISGMLVEPRSAEQIAAALTRLLSNRPLADEMGRAARRLAERNFTTDRWVSQTLAAYRLTTQPIASATAVPVK